MNFLKQLKDYWFLIVFIFGGVAAIGKLTVGGYVAGIVNTEIRSDASAKYFEGLIEVELLKTGVPSDTKITAIGGQLVLHDSQIATLTADGALTKQQLQDVARILMQPNR